MSVAPGQLGEIYNKIKECFISHPVISIAPTKGDPPDQYEITYNIKGMSKSDTGDILESDVHAIELTIPFGFPHFPPSCKPKSDIFHPDFDPAAICLGDFWHQAQTLTGLIIHIGRMINGEIYSTTNAFNEEAVTWYLDNSNILPLAPIEWGTSSEDDFPLDVTGREIDTLDDSDLMSDYNFQTMTDKGVEEEITLNTVFPDTDEAPGVDLQLLYLLQSQKKFYTLLEKVKEAPTSTGEISGLTQIATIEIEKAEQMHAAGRDFEEQANARESLERYQQVSTAVADFPSIGSDIKRITQTLALLEDMSFDHLQDLAQPLPAKTDEDFTAPDEIAPKPSAESRQATLETRKNAFLEGQGGMSKIPLYLLLGVLLSGVGCGGYFWYTFTHNLKKAEEAFSFCSQSLLTDQFESAGRSCENALQSLQKVKFIQQGKVQQLQDSIGKTLRSEKLTQGLAGNILFDGKYLPKNEVQVLQSTKTLQNDAEELYLEGKWQSAFNLYQKLYLQSKKAGHLSQDIVEDIKHKLLISEFRMSYESAQLPMQKGQWQEAAEKLIKAQRILETMPKTDREQYSEQLQYAIQKCHFEDFKTQGDLFFSRSDWQNAISGYNIALSSADENATLTPEIISTVKKNIKRAELYSTIHKGNEAYSSGAWDEAIEAYNEASIFLARNQTILSRTDADTNQLKLQRITLQASIIRDRLDAKYKLENNELKEARESYQQILDHIEKSPLAGEKEFVTTGKEVESALKSLDEKIFLAEKRDYLEGNYKTFFLNIYPTYLAENLSSPAIVYTREIGSKLVFRMQCTEKRGGGRPSTLRLYYAYDNKTGDWSQFSENQ